MTESLTLDRIPVGERCQVRSISGDRNVATRLMEMGLVADTPIRVLKVAPLGDPLELEVRGYRLSIRRAEARCVEVVAVNIPS